MELQFLWGHLFFIEFRPAFVMFLDMSENATKTSWNQTILKSFVANNNTSVYDNVIMVMTE